VKKYDNYSKATTRATEPEIKLTYSTIVTSSTKLLLPQSLNISQSLVLIPQSVRIWHKIVQDVDQQKL
jgi:hypothetical protein